MPVLKEWHDFYMTVGEATGTLIGLQFIALSFFSGRMAKRVQKLEIGAAFATPTIVHFGTVLFVSVLAIIPWESLRTVSIIWGAIGAGGILFTFRIPLHMRRVKSIYQPVLEDWLCHVLMPFTAYGLFFAAAVIADAHVHAAPFLVAGGMLLLLFVGVHNTWDAVSYHLFRLNEEDDR